MLCLILDQRKARDQIISSIKEIDSLRELVKYPKYVHLYPLLENYSENNRADLYSRIAEALIDNGDDQTKSSFWMIYNDVLIGAFIDVVNNKDIIEQYYKTNNMDGKSEWLLLVRNLIKLCIRIARIDYFWGTPQSRFYKHIKRYATGESLLKEIIAQINSAGKDTYCDLEDKYKIITSISNFFMKRYSMGISMEIYRKYNIFKLIKSSRWGGFKAGFKAFTKIWFTIPIIVGLIVGWLFLLQASEAVKYLLRLFKVYNPLLVTVSLILLFLIFLIRPFLLKALGNINLKTKEKYKRIGALVLLSYFFSLYFGLILIFSNKEWFIKIDEGLIRSIIDTRNYELIWIMQLFSFLWGIVAVFIGLFAQVIWSGRGPTEIME